MILSYISAAIGACFFWLVAASLVWLGILRGGAIIPLVVTGAVFGWLLMLWSAAGDGDEVQ